MIIQSSHIQMGVEHEKVEQSQLISQVISGGDNQISGFGFALQRAQSESLSMNAGWFTQLNDTPEENGTAPSVLVLTDQGLQFRTAESDSTMEEQQSLYRERLLQILLSALHPQNRSVTQSEPIELPAGAATEQAPTQPIRLSPVSLELSFRVEESISEYECTAFNSCGRVTTADGREIEFALDLKMERSYSATREYEETREVVFTDPLILNFDGNAADLSDEKYEFDLDADGDQELISYLAGNSAMLAIDRNEDGIINDGSELFGALSGNGFADLSAYDEDGNQYIDEADSIYDELLLWSKTESGETLETLAERDIGAIYLGSTETPFDIKGEENQHNGRVRASGIYLTEAGEVGTLQQIDMVV
ncbi:hypothetical protein [Neptuniibacter halophilus]|uniref:hypothetical protein n=1 Tax=Neptuniibacter halophilus TaxID=651666 RepID=UPI0025729FE8|nr:hypothetical protein [Neptuniibacter halophilus]